ncbi:hypothetical protein [Citrobacter freundii]|uniref:hypothetical protein n=1 Tax=Citrobacter freundii TaxID=546 RepID=UPI002E0D493B
MTTNNHPAHGPVSLDRLHQISEILSKAAAQSDGGNLGYAMADAVKVIDGEIASFGAEPVADVVAWSSPNEERTCDIRLRRHDIAPGPLYTAPPAPVSVPDLLEQFAEFMAAESIKSGDYPDGWQSKASNAAHEYAQNIRAAMLQAEHVSNSDELPMDYLQGHNDGLEWAAQLAEANHPQTGDWLYDDPIELARAIRKGPDMHEFKSVSVDEDDNFYSWFGRFWYENYQKNNYTTSAKQMLGTMAEFAYRAGGESAALAGNSPVTPDGYVLVPKKLTAENGAKRVLSGEFSETKFINCPECFGDDDCETCDGSGRIEITVPVSWTNIKAIWAKGVEHFAAAPQQEVKP